MSGTEVRWNQGWFKAVCSQPGVRSLLADTAEGVAASASAKVGDDPGMENPPFMSAVDVDRKGLPKGRAWAANPHAARAEAQRKILSQSM